MERAGGYYFDTGTCAMISDGRIKIQPGEIASFDPASKITFSDGSSGAYDLVIFATGYTGYKDTVAQVLGDAMAEQLSPVFGIDPEGEMNGIARDCGLPNVLFNVGNLASSRIFGKAVVLQILAQKNGKWSDPYYRPGGDVQASGTGSFVAGTNSRGNGVGRVETNGTNGVNGAANGHEHATVA
jgi:hypothetical protein